MVSTVVCSKDSNVKFIMVSFAARAETIYHTRQDHKTDTNDLEKMSNEGVLSIVLNNAKVQGSYG